MAGRRVRSGAGWLYGVAVLCLAVGGLMLLPAEFAGLAYMDAPDRRPFALRVLEVAGPGLLIASVVCFGLAAMLWLIELVANAVGWLRAARRRW